MLDYRIETLSTAVNMANTNGLEDDDHEPGATALPANMVPKVSRRIKKRPLPFLQQVLILQSCMLMIYFADHCPSTRSKVGTELVTLYIGPTKTKFIAFEKPLCDRIPYFHRMFRGQFKEATDNEATFPEDDPMAFDLLLEWVNNYSPRRIRELVQNVDSKGNKSASWDAIAVYSLAQKLYHPDLEDLIMTAIFKYHRFEEGYLSLDFIRRVYKETSAGHLQHYCMEVLVWLVTNKASNDSFSVTMVQ